MKDDRDQVNSTNKGFITIKFTTLSWQFAAKSSAAALFDARTDTNTQMVAEHLTLASRPCRLQRFPSHTALVFTFLLPSKKERKKKEISVEKRKVVCRSTAATVGQLVGQKLN